MAELPHGGPTTRRARCCHQWPYESTQRGPLSTATLAHRPAVRLHLALRRADGRIRGCGAFIGSVGDSRSRHGIGEVRRLYQRPRQSRTEALRRLLNVAADDLIWVAGSTMAPEERLRNRRLSTRPSDPSESTAVSGAASEGSLQRSGRRAASSRRPLRPTHRSSNGEWGMGNGE